MKHTKEPWGHFGEDDFDGIEINARDRLNKTSIANVPVGFSGEFETEQRANADRIVACVNAMAGIEDPQAFMNTVRKSHTVRGFALTISLNDRDMSRLEYCAAQNGMSVADQAVGLIQAGLSRHEKRFQKLAAREEQS